MSIGQRFREIRKARRLKQADVAKACGIAHGALVNYERGRRDPPAQIILTFCELYVVDLVWLMRGNGPSDTVALTQHHRQAVAAAWARISTAGEVQPDKLLRLSGALFTHCLEYGAFSEAMVGRLHALMEVVDNPLSTLAAGDRP